MRKNFNTLLQQLTIIFCKSTKKHNNCSHTKYKNNNSKYKSNKAEKFKVRHKLVIKEPF